MADIEGMYFRFGATIILAVLVAMTGVLLEKRTLDLRREITRQYYRTDVLLESYARLRLRTQQLAAPIRVIESIEDEVYVEPFRQPLQGRVNSAGRQPPTLLQLGVRQSDDQQIRGLRPLAEEPPGQVTTAPDSRGR